MLAVPTGSTHRSIRAGGFAPVRLASCSNGLNAFKAIKQGLSKDFNAFKCNSKSFEAKRVQVAMMVSKSPVLSALI